MIDSLRERIWLKRKKKWIGTSGKKLMLMQSKSKGRKEGKGEKIKGSLKEWKAEAVLKDTATNGKNVEEIEELEVKTDKRRIALREEGMDKKVKERSYGLWYGYGDQ